MGIPYVFTKLPITFWVPLDYNEKGTINWNLYVYLKITKIKNTVTLFEVVLAVYFAKCIVNSVDYSDGNIDFMM